MKRSGFRGQRRGGITLVVAACLTAIAGAAVAEQTSRSVMNVQGRLAATGGAPVADGTYPLCFGLYRVSSGGSAVFTETHPAVAVESGLYSVALGSVDHACSIDRDAITVRRRGTFGGEHP